LLYAFTQILYAFKALLYAFTKMVYAFEVLLYDFTKMVYAFMYDTNKITQNNKPMIFACESIK
jgi:hypothetical protein